MENTTTQDSFFSDIYDTSHTVAYAGFWIRFVAVIIDGFVLMIPNWIISTVLIGGTAVATDAANPFAIIAAMSTSIAITSILQILYKSIMESSSWQATLGKRALNLKVTDEHGQRISFGRSLGRSFASILSTMVMFIGYIMAAFSSRKQALHDKIASTLVVKNR
ncbi:RDD family protein [Rufibacter latericius]|uniref:RDD family protein n=1 Tax=Rufibacter latericius TaxID=2487040 RepID=A0A3M9MM45_9BACT|nr:RDD family protein [Rufibacter latericius]RNI26287.1 RDD family protein [Rufibacter latericius]